jgi:hypothetical protein
VDWIQGTLDMMKFLDEISGFQRGEYEDESLLGYSTL